MTKTVPAPHRSARRGPERTRPGGRLGRTWGAKRRAAALVLVLAPIPVLLAGCEDEGSTRPPLAPAPPPGSTPPESTSAAPQQADASASLFGTVRAEEGVPTAVVTVSGADTGYVFQSAITDEDGAFRFDALEPRRYRVSAQADGWTSADDPPSLDRIVEVARSESGEIAYDPSQTVSFALRRPAPLAITGRVLDRDVGGTPGAAVRAVNMATGFVEATTGTGPAGAYRIAGLYGDRYRVEADVAGRYEPNPGFVVRSPGRITFVVDLILGAPVPVGGEEFDRALWNQLVFGTFDDGGGGDACHAPNCLKTPGAGHSLRVLADPSPDFHIATEDILGGTTFSEDFIERMRNDLPRLVPLITGRPYAGEIVVGPHRERRAGSVLITSVEDDSEAGWCGRATVGSARGRIELRRRTPPEEGEEPGPGSGPNCLRMDVFRHEIGHAMGFFHPSWDNYPDAIMGYTDASDLSPAERFHMQLAYAHGRGVRYESGPLLPSPPAGAGNPEPDAPMVVCPPAGHPRATAR